MNNAETITKAISGSLNIIEQEREREIISRRFGLNGHKETLEQIGEMLSITRERVRQLEKAILIRLRIAADRHKTTSDDCFLADEIIDQENRYDPDQHDRNTAVFREFVGNESDHRSLQHTLENNVRK